MSMIASEKDLVTKGDCDSHVRTMTDEIKDVKDAVNSLRVDVACLPKKVLDEARGEFASKTTEKIVYSLVGLICLAVIGSIINSTIAVKNNAVDEATITELIDKAIDNYDKEIFEIIE